MNYHFDLRSHVLGIALAVGAGALMSTTAITPAHAASVTDAVETALKTNPDVAAASSNRRAVDQELRQARGLYLPQVDLRVGMGIEGTNDARTRSTPTDDLESMKREEYGATVTQRLFDGFEASSSVEKQKARVLSAARRVSETSEFVALDAIGAYLEVLRQRDLLRLAEENVRVHTELAQGLRTQLQRGAGSRADVAQAETRVAQTRATLSQVANDLRDAEALYERTVGTYPEALDPVPSPASSLPADRQSAHTMAQKNNPTVRITEADVEAASGDVGVATSRFYPSVNLELSSDYWDQIDGVKTYEWDYQAMVRLRWNIYRGGIDRALRHEMLERVAEAKDRRRQAQFRAREEVRKSWNALEAARRRTSEYQDAVRYAVETRNAYREQFNVGQRTLLDVLDAENEVFTTSGLLVTARSNEMRAAYRVLAVTGRLLESLNIKRPMSSTEQQSTFFQGVKK